MTTTLTSLDSVLRDYYPRAGERYKQYVIDERREAAWADATCPYVDVPAHFHETGEDCGYDEPAHQWQWHKLYDRGCDVCDRVHDEALTRADVQQWLTEKAARPPVCADRSKFSDVIVEDIALADHPILGMFKNPGTQVRQI